LKLIHHFVTLTRARAAVKNVDVDSGVSNFFRDAIKNGRVEPESDYVRLPLAELV
jgi:hypothetical protein